MQPDFTTLLFFLTCLLAVWLRTAFVEVYTLTNSGCYLKSICSSQKLISHLISYSNEMGELLPCFSEVCARWAIGTAEFGAEPSPAFPHTSSGLGWEPPPLFKEQLQAFPQKCSAMENTLAFQASKLDSNRCAHLIKLC